MNEKEAELLLLDQIPMALRPSIPTTLTNAYAAASLVISGEQILQTPSAQDNRGRIVAWSVDRGFEKLIESGQWPFDKRWQKFARPTGHYLEIRTPYAVVTISQVEDPKKQPRDVKYRANLRLSSQPPLPLREFDDDRSIIGVPHILLVHGHQQLNFAQLGLPNEQHDLGYIYRTPNLMNLPHEVTSPVPPTEQTDYEAVMTLKHEIDKWRRDNGEK